MPLSGGGSAGPSVAQLRLLACQQQRERPTVTVRCAKHTPSPARPPARPPAWQVYEWEVHDTPIHPFHLHTSPYQIMFFPPERQPGCKDTTFVEVGTPAQLKSPTGMGPARRVHSLPSASLPRPSTAGSPASLALPPGSLRWPAGGALQVRLGSRSGRGAAENRAREEKAEKPFSGGHACDSALLPPPRPQPGDFHDTVRNRLSHFNNFNNTWSWIVGSQCFISWLS